MLHGQHFSTADAAQAFFQQNDWTEFAVDRWISPDGASIASVKPVRVYALDLQAAPVVAVTVEAV